MTVACQQSPSALGRQRILSRPHEPLFLADWCEALMLHLGVDAAELQRAVPFRLDVRDGEAFVTLVAFTMRRMRPKIGGRISQLLLRPIATHSFLNVRTYVRHENEAGIYFMTEWLSNRLSLALGPRFFGLPYRLGRLEYTHPTLRDRSTGIFGELSLRGRVSEDGVGSLAYTGRMSSGAEPSLCEPDSLTEWLMERYTAFTCARGRARFFRVWHLPWQQIPAEIELQDMSLLERRWGFFRRARFVGANYSHGLKDVWMGWPHRL